MRHPRGRIAVGYTAATRSVYLSMAELAGHGLAVGAPKSGKTNLLQLLIEAAAGQIPIVILDPKASPALAGTVRSHGGQVWTLDGKLPVDLLDPRPHQVPDMLLEAEDYGPDARVFRDAAHQRALWAAWSLALNGQPMDLTQLRRLLDRDELIAALEPHRGRDPRIDDWLRRLGNQHGGVEDSGARGLDRALGILLDGVALRGSLRTCPEAIRLEDVLAARGLMLFSLDDFSYQTPTRKIAAWVMLTMGRLATTLPPDDGSGRPRALLLVDEVGALGSSARHLRGLVGRAREAGLAVVMATQGLSDLRAVDHALVDQVLQDTAWQIGFRQGSPNDAALMESLFGQEWVEDVTRFSDGRTSSRRAERPRVPADEWKNGLDRGDAWLRVAPIEGRWRQERVRVALPKSRSRGSVITEVKTRSTDSVSMYSHLRLDSGVGMTEEAVPEARGMRATPTALPPVPPECPAELVAMMGEDVLSKCERRWPKRRHALGPCLVWTGPKGPDAQTGPYGRLYDPTLKRTDYTHKVVWRRVYGLIPLGANGRPLEVDHKCKITLCQRPDHLELLTKRDNVKRRGPTRGPNKRDAAARQFAIALFARYDRPAVRQRTVDLDDLVVMLATFDEIVDKREARCWSPTLYANGATSRANAGVAAVSALVFDLDRVPPDPELLAGVCWIGHTTWSHRTEAPRWRVVVPLAEPVPASSWGDVWRRARATLCPEADPSCKDSSRQYYLPSHPPGVAPEASHHDGPLLNPSTLPELPAEERAELRRSPSTKNPRKTTGADHRRGDDYMAGVVRKLATAAPGGRNAALNGAAWTLGRWIAAGALDQADVEDELYAAAEANGLVADDGVRQCWATIRSGLGKGLLEPIDLDIDEGAPRRRSRHS